MLNCGSQKLLIQFTRRFFPRATVKSSLSSISKHVEDTAKNQSQAREHTREEDIDNLEMDTTPRINDKNHEAFKNVS
jgi:hypothetical protein